MKVFVVFVLIISSFSLDAQITLVPHDEPGKSGIKSIVFEYFERDDSLKKVKKEFDVQANNPYNNLSYEVRGKKKDGSKIYGIASSAKSSIYAKMGRKSNQTFHASEEPLIAKSHWFVDLDTKFAAIAYNLFCTILETMLLMMVEFRPSKS